MSQIDECEIKAALTAAKKISEIKKARREYPFPSERYISERAQIRANQQAVQRLLETTLVRSGFDVDKYDAIRVRNQAAFRSIAEEQKADAIKRSSLEKNVLRNAVDGRRKTIEQLMALATPAGYVPLDTPFLIWASLGLYFEDPHYEPWNSSIKVKFSSSGGSDWPGQYSREEVSFYFFWVNPTDYYAVVNVEAYLVLNGHCRAGAEWGYLSGGRSTLVVDAELRLVEWWNQPPTLPIHQSDQYQEVASLDVYGGDIFDPGEIGSEEVFRGYDLRYNAFSIPQRQTAVFEAAVSFGSGNQDGWAEADFASGDFEILCPFVLIQILTSQ